MVGNSTSLDTCDLGFLGRGSLPPLSFHAVISEKGVLPEA